MFRNVPACSGMFHVPGFIDAPHTDLPKIPAKGLALTCTLTNIEPLTCLKLTFDID